MEKKYCYYCMRGENDPIQPCINCHSGDLPPYAAHQLKPGTVLHEKYLVGQVIGQGGFGITYIGRDLTLDMRVAIKEYYPVNYVVRNNAVANGIDFTQPQNYGQFERGIDRFLTEARTLAKFYQEPGIVGVRDFFRENKTAYIVMDYLDGITLKDYLDLHGKIPASVIIPMMYPVMDSLAKIHELHHIHRDISPDNIMVLKNGTLVLVDFGASKDVDGSHSLSVVLKPHYAPEEQYRTKGKQGAWTDIYALAATIYHCITGEAPDESIQRLYEDELQSPLELGVELSHAENEALMTALNVHQEDRFQSMESFKLALMGKKSSGEEIRSFVVDHEKHTIDEEELKKRPRRSGTPTVEDPKQDKIDDSAEKAAAEKARKEKLEREMAEKAAEKAAMKLVEKAAKKAERDAARRAFTEKLAAKQAARAKRKAEKAAEKQQKKAENFDPQKSAKKAKNRRIMGKLAITFLIIIAVIGAAYGIYSLTNVKICGQNYSAGEEYISLINKTLTNEDIEAISRLKKLNYLSLDNCDLSAFNGIGTMKNLNTLTILECSGLDSIDFIRKMPALQMLTIDGSDLSGADMQPITEHIAFGALKLTNCSLSDASFLEGMDHVVGLDLSGNKIAEIDLSSLKAVGILNINNNPIEELVLPPSLSEFYADNTGISNMRMLKDLDMLSILSLRNNGIDDISALANLAEIKHLYLDGNSIADISAVSGLTKLETLAMNGNNVENLHALHALIYLREIRFGRNQLQDISGLENCTRLATVQLDGNGLSDVSVLGKSAKYIERLYLADNHISDISFLADAEKLIFLDADNNEIADMSWLDSADTESIRGLSLSGNKIAHSYYNLPNLQYFDLSYNEFEEAIDLSLGKKLNYVDISGSNIRSLIGHFDSHNVIFIADGTPLEQIVASGVEYFHTIALTNNPKLFGGIDYTLTKVPGKNIIFSYSREWGKLDYIPEWNYLNTYVLNPPLDCITDLEDASIGSFTTFESLESVMLLARGYHTEDLFISYPY